jgi:hypothetical protein
LISVIRTDESNNNIRVEANRHPLATEGFEGDIPNASVLHPNDDRPILKQR